MGVNRARRWRGAEAVRKPPVTSITLTGSWPRAWGTSVLNEYYLPRLFWLSSYGRRDGICEAYHWIVLSPDKDGECVGQLQV